MDSGRIFIHHAGTGIKVGTTFYNTNTKLKDRET
jgi:hypothetical protein